MYVKIEIDDLDEIVAFNTRKIMFMYGKEVRMTELDIKIGVRYYHKYCAKIKKLKNDLLFIDTKMQGKVSSSFIKMPEQINNSDSVRLELIEKKSKIEKDLKTYEYYVSIVDEFIRTSKDLCPQNELVNPDQLIEVLRGLYLNNISLKRISVDYGIAERSVYNLIDRAITRYIESC